MGITAQELAERLGAELHGDPGAEISRIGNLAAAKKDELSFLSDSKYREGRISRIPAPAWSSSGRMIWSTAGLRRLSCRIPM